MEVRSLAKELSTNEYPGRGIIIGKSSDGKNAVAAYFIMGRSENSRNRIFVEDGDGIRTQAFDPSKMTDPSLIIYAPVRVLGNKTIVTNGDQTDTIYEGMDHQMTFEQSLRSREFEPDGPNYTPRISGVMHVENGEYNYAMSILKSNNGNPDACNRYTFAYTNPVAGEGHFIHTYKVLYEGGKLENLPPDAFADENALLARANEAQDDIKGKDENKEDDNTVAEENNTDNEENAGKVNGQDSGKDTVLLYPADTQKTAKERNEENKNSDETFYCIQILSVNRELGKTSPDLKGRKDAEFVKIGGAYKYYLGNWSTRSEAAKHLNQVSRTFKGAFVIKISNGKIVN